MTSPISLPFSYFVKLASSEQKVRFRILFLSSTIRVIRNFSTFQSIAILQGTADMGFFKRFPHEVHFAKILQMNAVFFNRKHFS
jgi:hypothetical protein